MGSDPMLPDTPVLRRKGGRMGTLVAALVFLAVWVFLQAWLLPRLGVPT